MMEYVYPGARHRRRHGPAGYHDVESFRPWLRDEFSFRCVYCLEREAWSNLVAAFAIDHFVPVSKHPAKSLDYDNLLYACRACNAVKGQLRVPDPLKVMLSETVLLHQGGHIEGVTDDARLLIDMLQLDRPAYVVRRRLVQSMLRMAETHDPIFYRQLLGFPSVLPDLSRLRPPSNSRPNGVAKSFHAQRMNGVLPAVY